MLVTRVESPNLSIFKMNLLDILLAIPLVYFIYKGWKRGLIFELAMLCGIVVGSLAASRLARGIADLLKLEGDAAVLIAFFIIFVGVIFIAFFLSKAVEGFVKLVKVGTVNNILGAALGMLKCLCILSVILNFILLVDRGNVIITQTTKDGSVLFEPIYKVGNRLTSHLNTYVIEKRSKQ